MAAVRKINCINTQVYSLIILQFASIISKFIDISRWFACLQWNVG